MWKVHTLVCFTTYVYYMEKFTREHIDYRQLTADGRSQEPLWRCLPNEAISSKKTNRLVSIFNCDFLKILLIFHFFNDSHLKESNILTSNEYSSLEAAIF